VRLTVWQRVRCRVWDARFRVGYLVGGFTSARRAGQVVRGPADEPGWRNPAL
jgi:hypothetical protein